MKWSLEQAEGAREMAHCLGTLDALAGDQGSEDLMDSLVKTHTHTHTHTHTLLLPFLFLNVPFHLISLIKIKISQASL